MTDLSPSDCIRKLELTLPPSAADAVVEMMALKLTSAIAHWRFFGLGSGKLLWSDSWLSHSVVDLTLILGFVRWLVRVDPSRRRRCRAGPEETPGPPASSARQAQRSHQHASPSEWFTGQSVSGHAVCDLLALCSTRQRAGVVPVQRRIARVKALASA